MSRHQPDSSQLQNCTNCRVAAHMAICSGLSSNCSFSKMMEITNRDQQCSTTNLSQCCFRGIYQTMVDVFVLSKNFANMHLRCIGFKGFDKHASYHSRRCHALLAAFFMLRKTLDWLGCSCDEVSQNRGTFALLNFNHVFCVA